MPTTLKDWVAGPNHLPTEVKEPIYIDYHAIPELIFYHPTAPAIGACEFRLVADPTNTFAICQLEPSNWNPQWSILVSGLKLRLEQDVHNIEILIDKNTQPVKLGPSEWQAVEWKIAQSQDANGANIFQELISWKNKDGDTAFSSYGWLPYKSESS